MKKILYLLIIFAVSIISCKKNKEGSNDNAPSKTGTVIDLVRDSVYLYAKEDYYWHDALPDYATFKPRSFTGGNDLGALTNEVNALSQYKINSATGKPYEYSDSYPGEAKYSFIDEGQVSTQLNGTRGDFGFSPLYNDVNDLRVKYVYPGSPAGLAGVKRGYQITAINGRTNLAYDGADGTNVQFVINAYLSGTTISMTLKRPDATTFNVNLTATNYTVNPVIAYKTLDQGNGHIVGYMVFNSFTSDANADAQINTAFNSFAGAGVTDLVIDLRYNGGGYVSTSEYLANLIVPAAKTGTLMYNTYFNDVLTSGKASILANQVRIDPVSKKSYNYAQFDYSVAGNAVKFSKQGSFNVNRVFFIVTGNTASASELLINNLRPHVNVQLVGGTTYGKPVGFFDIDINKYELYIPEFETKNSAGQGGYFTGMTPGSTDYPGYKDYDDVTKDFGDPTEGLLQRTLNYVKYGTYAVNTPQIQGLSTSLRTFSVEQANSAAIKLNKRVFSGMIFNKGLKLKK